MFNVKCAPFASLTVIPDTPIRFAAGGRQLQGVQSFGSVENPRLPKSVARADWGPKFPSTGNKKLLAVQSFGSVEAPKQPKSVARAEWGPKFPSTGNKKLLAFVAPQQPKKPAEVASSRFAPRKASGNAAAQGGR
jgi:hypothetical protein